MLACFWLSTGPSRPHDLSHVQALLTVECVVPPQDWESKRDERVTGWHEYMKTGGKKQGGVKPPKMKTNDEVTWLGWARARLSWRAVAHTSRQQPG
jgi:hypothetical protein